VYPALKFARELPSSCYRELFSLDKGLLMGVTYRHPPIKGVMFHFGGTQLLGLVVQIHRHDCTVLTVQTVSPHAAQNLISKHDPVASAGGSSVLIDGTHGCLPSPR